MIIFIIFKIIILIQEFITDYAIEGVVAGCCIAFSQCLLEDKKLFVLNEYYHYIMKETKAIVESKNNVGKLGFLNYRLIKPTSEQMDSSSIWNNVKNSYFLN